MQRVIDQFDKKDLEVHFRELAQRKQTSTPDAYIEEFQQVVVMVTNIFEQMMVMVFTEGLAELLRGWVNAFKPTTLQDAITMARDMGGTVPKVKFPPQPLIPLKDEDKKPFQRDGTRKDRLDKETWSVLRRKKLCFTWKKPWKPGHRCLGKGKVHYIEVVFDSDNEDDTMPTPSKEPSSSREEQSLEEAKGDKRPSTRIKGGTIASLWSP